MNKYAFASITSLFFSFQPLHAGGPWIIYNGVIDGEGPIFPLNLAYDNDPQFAFTEQDPDEEVNLTYNPKGKKDLEAGVGWGQHFEQQHAEPLASPELGQRQE